MLLPCLDKSKIEAGCDEAGRGPLAGPVFAAAVIWPADLYHGELRDSKLLSEKKRYILRDFIIENAVSYSVSMIDNEEIDKINILNASIKAMHIALRGLNQSFDFILADGNKFRQFDSIEYKTIIKGDNKFLSIAAASILAKTFRDDYMIHIDSMHPEYNWKKNKGYPTRRHIEAVKKYGISGFHRKSFCESYKYEQTFIF